MQAFIFSVICYSETRFLCFILLLPDDECEQCRLCYDEARCLFICHISKRLYILQKNISLHIIILVSRHHIEIVVGHLQLGHEIHDNV